MADLPDKVLQYEKFLNENLKGDLKKVLDQRDEVYGQIAEYLQLKTVIEKLKEMKLTEEELKTKVDLGCNFYVQAVVPDVRKIFVFVGYGFFVELTLNEALKFIDKRTAFLRQYCDKLSENAFRIKANIRVVLEGLRELQRVENEPVQEFRDIFA